MRAFIAITLPAEIQKAVAILQDELKTGLPKISWIEPGNLHITLKFLGEISDGQLNNIKQIIAEISKKTTQFQIKLDKFGVFPDISGPRIIWIGTNNTFTEIKKIAEQLELKIEKLGAAKETRAFSIHLTIGRIKTDVKLENLEKILNKAGKNLINKNLEFVAQGITLFKSRLDKAGAVYTVLKQANFKTT
ncbi:MAG: RNA 2',3'-cyclic phosphodiesterase [Candidatus Omnitrophica bacterium]|jgi:2'-5' RNA ligase|nr:RNA 2',3'-cyclic phosphodiesterase [Candidatus Omnitrophota bacterium]MDD5660659.1 RNA 2',3'-cyclic phosphodiesterase [Candidatus Omnitrophota bacterium]